MDANKRRNKKIASKIKKMSKEDIAAAVIKKRECNERAMKIIERLLEPNVDTDWMLENLQHINQSHFDDVVEERSIGSACGYALCDNKLENVPAKQFRISTKQNKVYDITERKKYCSNHCFKSGRFLKDQLYTSPLWMRDCEEPVVYELYSTKNESEGAGIVVDIAITESIAPPQEETKPEDDRDPEEDDDEAEERIELRTQEKLDIVEACIKAAIEKHNSSKSQPTTVEPLSPEEILKDVQDLTPSKEDRPHKKVKKPFRKPKEPKKQVPIKDIVISIEQKIRSWMTFDTLCFLNGEESVKELLLQNGASIEQYRSQEAADPLIYERYMDICRKLNLLDLKEAEPPQEKNPLPDYEELKSKTKEMEIKVRTFYRGDTVRFEEPEKEKEPTVEPRLPLIDRHATKAARRKILSDQIKKAIPDMMRALNITLIYPSEMAPFLSDLIFTFNLTPTNIVFRPTEWNFVALVILKMVSFKFPDLQEKMSTEECKKALQLILMSYELDLGYPDRLITWLSDFTYLLSTRDDT